MKTELIKIALVAVAGMALFGSSTAANARGYKQDYCGNLAYVPENREAHYPHLHCDKGYIRYSRTSNDGKYLIKGDQVYCEHMTSAIGDINDRKFAPDGKLAMLASIQRLQTDYCR